MSSFFGIEIFGKEFISFVLILFTSISAFVYLIHNKKLDIYLNKLEQIWVSNGFSKFIFEIIIWIITMIIWTAILSGVVYAFHILGIIN